MTPMLAVGLIVLAGGTLQSSGGTLRASPGTFGSMPAQPPLYRPPPPPPPPSVTPRQAAGPEPTPFKPYKPYQGTGIYNPPAKPKGYVDYYKP